MHRCYEHRGPLAVFVARFIAVLRTFGAIVAGAAEMRYRSFLVVNALGGAAWPPSTWSWVSELGRAYTRFGGALTGVSSGAGIALLPLAVGGVVVARKRLERWALGDPDDFPKVGA